MKLLAKSIRMVNGRHSLVKFNASPDWNCLCLNLNAKTSRRYCSNARVETIMPECKAIPNGQALGFLSAKLAQISYINTANKLNRFSQCIAISGCAKSREFFDNFWLEMLLVYIWLQSCYILGSTLVYFYNFISTCSRALVRLRKLNIPSCTTKLLYCQSTT